MRNMIVRPHSMNGRTTTSKGKGFGSVLLHGTAGVAGTLTNDAPSVDNMREVMGKSVNSNITAKLDKLQVITKKKPSNIRFSI